MFFSYNFQEKIRELQAIKKGLFLDIMLGLAIMDISLLIVFVEFLFCE